MDLAPAIIGTYATGARISYDFFRSLIPTTDWATSTRLYLRSTGEVVPLLLCTWHHSMSATDEPATIGYALPEDPADKVNWLHEESGLTWDQIARLFGVSRRAVHLWAIGKNLSARNSERVSRVYNVVRELDATSPDGRRDALFAHRPGQKSVYDDLLSEISSPKVEATTSVDVLLGVATEQRESGA